MCCAGFSDERPALAPIFAAFARSLALRETRRLSDSAFIDSGRTRVRAASMTASALIVGAICLGLLIASRVIPYFEDPAISAVNVSIEERRVQRPPARVAPTRAVPTRNSAAPPTITPLAVGRDVLARMQSCLNRRVEDRPADCPRDAAPANPYAGELPTGGDFYRPPPVDLRTVFTTAELATIMSAPPCNPGIHVTNLQVTGCMRFGITPPGPTLSPVEICAREGIGPCTPPDIPPPPRLAHTQ